MWQKCRQMLPHATKVAELAEKFRVSPEHTIHLYAQIASFLRELNNLTEAEIYANRALAIVNRIGIIDSLHHVVCLETRARILRDLGRNIEAEDLMLRAIAIEEKQRGEVTGVHNQKNSLIDRSHLAVCYDGYGRILSNLNQSQKSLEYYSKALALDLKTYGDNHPKIAIRKNNIGCAYGQLGNDDLNIKNLKEALAIEETYYANKHQEKHPHIAIRLSNLALAYEKNRDRDLSGTNLDLAHQYWNQSIDINHGFYGLSSNHTLSSIYGLAGHFRIRKEYEKALEQNNKAINITKGSDPDGYYHALSFLHRGNTYTEKEENVNALADYQQAAHLISCSRGTENSDYSVILQNIAYIKFKQGDIPAAVENQEKSLEIDMRNKRTSGQGYGIALLNLGMYCLQAHEHVKAKNAFSLALPLLEKECGTYSQNYFYALCAFIDTKINTKDTADISELIQKGRKIKDFLNKNA
jgi:tetratricopeptide (TPR) repeat protein